MDVEDTWLEMNLGLHSSQERNEDMWLLEIMPNEESLDKEILVITLLSYWKCVTSLMV